MISKNNKTYQLKKQESLLNEYGEMTPCYTKKGEIDVSVTLKENKVLENNPIYLSATHIGLTRATNIEVGDLLQGDKTYKVILLVADGRYKAWLLREVTYE